MEIASWAFDEDEGVPNNPALPLLLYRGAIDPAAEEDLATAFETRFKRAGWGAGWRNGIYAFHHYHSTAHEVLGIARGRATVRFGGETGETVSVKAGDAVVIPAGVGHKRLAASDDLLVVGAYPAGQPVDLLRAGEGDRAAILARIGALSLPNTDPLTGVSEPLVALWQRAAGTGPS
ncbi:cupin domain-containing protein [Prosthecomicrobium pneumaticum]|uniref:Uncharacterized protein YjlB n=1 Tax=Prosthecomicrobium pneumaticum TaxID=81895 RepID=A0A7W9L3Z2_9HYPH|nr:cupin domain-containing protein [Prosthecomicrobium pneumaticum]MBB5755060.1 uncharacterized protein YjlB [Prosthecomicrobium pneumaticum]